MVGKVQYVNKEKGFGFIQSNGHVKGIFFHIKNFMGDFESIQKGDSVSFVTVETDKGTAAQEVKFV